uniref:ADAM metallopeptidase domain 32 n=1 Tax=Junco hyemalis TaxID=40217 RepID=A0A8C5NJ84_JUNHY
MAAHTLCSPFAAHSRPWIVLFPTPCSHFSLSLLFCMHKEKLEELWVMDAGGCHYWGYIDGFPSSAVTLNTCSGLRGLLQFENVSYSIQPLGYSPAFQHVLYRVGEEQMCWELFQCSNTAMISTLSALVSSWVVFQYNYMGSDPNAATQNVMQAFNLINNMFNPLNVTIVLSSLELWAEGDKISTAGDTEDILQRFLQWKQFSLEPQAHNIASLLGYRHQGSLVGAAAPGKACQRDAAATVYHGNVTLESFSVLLAQVLGHSLGMSPDSPRGCSCPGRVCTMSPEAYFSGSKAFSNCSIRDFEFFLKQGRGDCLFSSPRLSRQSRQSGAVCGNGVVEPGEQCDCGTAQECQKDRCCAPNCRLKPRAKCASGLCCRNCQFKWRNTLCRPAADAQCDLPEFCSGSSASCPPDVYVQDGQECWRGTGYCYQGRCQSPDLQCRRIYGTDSKNAPVMCYEEINGQRDRFGHCGFQPNHKYRRCVWRDLRCGKLVCTYPSHKPFLAPATAVMYARVKHHICVTLHYLNVSTWLDPLLVTPGTKCGSGRVCMNGTCHPVSVLGPICDSNKKCHGHGVCNNKGNCHCNMGWQPPDCQWRGSRRGGSMDSGLQFTEGGEWAPVGWRGQGWQGLCGAGSAHRGWQCLCPYGLDRQAWQCLCNAGSACAQQCWQCLCRFSRAGSAQQGWVGSACAQQGWQCLCPYGLDRHGWQCLCPAGLAVPMPIQLSLPRPASNTG